MDSQKSKASRQDIRTAHAKLRRVWQGKHPGVRYKLASEDTPRSETLLEVTDKYFVVSRSFESATPALAVVFIDQLDFSAEIDECTFFWSSNDKAEKLKKHYRSHLGDPNEMRYLRDIRTSVIMDALSSRI